MIFGPSEYDYGRPFYHERITYCRWNRHHPLFVVGIVLPGGMYVQGAMVCYVCDSVESFPAGTTVVPVRR